MARTTGNTVGNSPVSPGLREMAHSSRIITKYWDPQPESGREGALDCRDFSKSLTQEKLGSDPW